MEVFFFAIFVTLFLLFLLSIFCSKQRFDPPATPAESFENAMRFYKSSISAKAGICDAHKFLSFTYSYIPTQPELLKNVSPVLLLVLSANACMHRLKAFYYSYTHTNANLSILLIFMHKVLLNPTHICPPSLWFPTHPSIAWQLSSVIARRKAISFMVNNNFISSRFSENGLPLLKIFSPKNPTHKREFQLLFLILPLRHINMRLLHVCECACR